MWNVLEQIWQLPWYSILFVAAVDDIIVMFKIWPVLLALFLLALYVVITEN